MLSVLKRMGRPYSCPGLLPRAVEGSSFDARAMRAVLQRDLMMLAWLNARWTGFGFALIGTVVAVSASSAASPAASRDRNHRPRVASINLCTDQLLLSLADPDQIVGLSPYIRD